MKVYLKTSKPGVFYKVHVKEIIHPGGKRLTKEIHSMANIQSGHKALDIGCGAGTTAIEREKDVLL